MILIPVTKEKVAVVDECDMHLSVLKWHVDSGGYVRRNDMSSVVKKLGLKRGAVRLHHAIMGQPIEKNMDIDHINGNPLDNRRENLRIVSTRINCQNMRCHRDKTLKTSKYIGVYWRKDVSKWQGQITIDRKHVYLGLFNKEEDAAEAYQNALSSHESKSFSASLKG